MIKREKGETAKAYCKRVNKLIAEAKKLKKKWNMPKQAAVEITCAGHKLTDEQINAIEKGVE